MSPFPSPESPSPVAAVEINEFDRRMMREAIRQADESVRRGGGPFGAVVVRGSEVVGVGSNSVTLDNDPTAHAEVNAIRQACRRLGTFDLSGCRVYTSCEPCPMCLGAIYWAHIDRIYYANTRQDPAEAGFADDLIYRELAVPMTQRQVPIVALLRDEALATFRAWTADDNRRRY